MDDFYKISNQALEEMANYFESSWLRADVDLLEGALTVSLSPSLQYVIHRHGVTQQLWLASPFTGAHHFQLKDGQWQCTRTGINLYDFLETEQKNYAA